MVKMWKSAYRALKKLQMKYQNMREKWKAKTPWQKWNFIYNLGKFFVELIGIKAFGDMKNYWRTAIAGVLGLIYLLLTIYTVQYHMRQHNLTRAMACSYTFGLFILVSFAFFIYWERRIFLCFDKKRTISRVIHVVFQDMCGYWTVIGPSRFKFNSLVNFGGNYIYQNENQSMKFRQICAKHAKKLTKSVMTGLPLMFLTHVMILVVAAYAHYWQNISITPLAINLPFFDPKDSNCELVVNMIFQLTMGIHAIIGCLGLEIGECLFNNTIIAIPDVIQLNLSQFNDEYEANGMNLKSILQLRNTFCQIQDYQQYVD